MRRDRPEQRKRFFKRRSVEILTGSNLSRRPAIRLIARRLSIDPDLDLSLVREFQYAVLRVWRQIKRAPKPACPKLARFQALQTLAINGAGKNQPVFSARCGDIKQPHTLKIIAPAVSATQLVKERTPH